MPDPAELLLLPLLWLAGAWSLARPRQSFAVFDRLAARLPDPAGVGPAAVFGAGKEVAGG